MGYRNYADLQAAGSGSGQRVKLIVPARQPGWEEMEILRGNLRRIEEIL